MSDNNRRGTQTLNRIEQAIWRRLPKPIKDYLQSISESQAEQSEELRQGLSATAAGRLINRINEMDATGETIEAIAEATNTDARIVSGIATAAEAVVGARAGANGIKRLSRGGRVTTPTTRQSSGQGTPNRIQRAKQRAADRRARQEHGVIHEVPGRPKERIPEDTSYKERLTKSLEKRTDPGVDVESVIGKGDVWDEASGPVKPQGRRRGDQRNLQTTQEAEGSRIQRIADGQRGQPAASKAMPESVRQQIIDEFQTTNPRSGAVFEQRRQRGKRVRGELLQRGTKQPSQEYINDRYQEMLSQGRAKAGRASKPKDGPLTTRQETPRERQSRIRKAQQKRQLNRDSDPLGQDRVPDGDRTVPVERKPGEYDKELRGVRQQEARRAKGMRSGRDLEDEPNRQGKNRISRSLDIRNASPTDTDVEILPSTPQHRRSGTRSDKPYNPQAAGPTDPRAGNYREQTRTTPRDRNRRGRILTKRQKEQLRNDTSAGFTLDGELDLGGSATRVRGARSERIPSAEARAESARLKRGKALSEKDRKEQDRIMRQIRRRRARRGNS